MGDLERAIQFATEAHAGQVDKQGKSYIDHCLRVMGAVSAPAKRVAVLHDVAEDTGRQVQDIASELDLSDAEWSALYLLTRSYSGPCSYQGYIVKLATASARMVATWPVR